MQLTLIKNDDEHKIAVYKIARIIYAETSASSLSAVEALACMIGNLCQKSLRQLSDIANDKNIFESLNENSSRHCELSVDGTSEKFQMCLRAAQKMSNGKLPDSVRGATRFHRVDLMPDWAVSIGSVAEIDGLSFYS